MIGIVVRNGVAYLYTGMKGLLQVSLTVSLVSLLTRLIGVALITGSTFGIEGDNARTSLGRSVWGSS